MSKNYEASKNGGPLKKKKKKADEKESKADMLKDEKEPAGVSTVLSPRKR